jgi:RNA ligase
MKFNLDILKNYINDGYISCRKHPIEDLYIYNYTQKCQFSKYWDEITLQCRGLVLDAEGNVIAKPFNKFMNYEEYKGAIPNEPFEVTSKEDGSLGIIFNYHDKWYITTRGGFESEQAFDGKKILDLIDLSKFRKNFTYLAEIICPSSRVVVNYNNQRKLIFITRINTETGIESSYEELKENIGDNCEVVERFDGIKDFTKLIENNTTNKEGFVIHFLGESNLRLKLKFSDYVRLHRIITGITARRIWDCLRMQTNMKEITENVPEEFSIWVKSITKELGEKFASIMSQTKKDYKSIIESLELEAPISMAIGDKLNWNDFIKIDRTFKKKLNELFLEKENPDILNAIHNNLEGKKIVEMVWKKLRPAHELPFIKNNEDEE